MHLSLQLYLIEHYTKPGDTILDPMLGSGTLLIACALGRHVIGIELEQKFVDMAKANWEKIKSLGPMLGFTMGDCKIICGDSRALPELLVDKCVFSPPFADSEHNYKHGLKTLGKNFKGRKAWETKGQQVDKILTSPPFSKQMQDVKWMQENQPGKYRGTHDEKNQSPNNISNLPYGKISAVISSPPYAGAKQVRDKEFYAKALKDLEGRDVATENAGLREGEDSSDNISNLPYGSIDKIISSPPYADQAVGNEKGYYEKNLERLKKVPIEKLGRESKRLLKTPPNPHTNLKLEPYSNSKNNIGNLKSTDYLSAMAQVYQNCHKALRDGGLLCLVVKNFIRNKKIVQLDFDTIKVCKQAGFTLKERLKRKLTQQSFWRIIYQKKYPDVEQITHEDILIFRK